MSWLWIEIWCQVVKLINKFSVSRCQQGLELSKEISSVAWPQTQMDLGEVFSVRLSVRAGGQRL